MRAQANVTRRVVAREGGRSSIAEELMINREAAAYWIPAFAGMTAGPATNAICLRMRAQRSNLAFASPSDGLVRCARHVWEGACDSWLFKIANAQNERVVILRAPLERTQAGPR